MAPAGRFVKGTLALALVGRVTPRVTVVPWWMSSIRVRGTLAGACPEAPEFQAHIIEEHSVGHTGASALYTGRRCRGPFACGPIGWRTPILAPGPPRRSICRAGARGTAGAMRHAAVGGTLTSDPGSARRYGAAS